MEAYTAKSSVRSSKLSLLTLQRPFDRADRYCAFGLQRAEQGSLFHGHSSGPAMKRQAAIYASALRAAPLSDNHPLYLSEFVNPHFAARALEVWTFK